MKVTVPYWKLVNSRMKCTTFHKYMYMYVQKLHSSLEKWSVDPSEIIDLTFKSVVGEEMAIESPMSRSVHSFIEHNANSVIEIALRAMAHEAKLVTERQLVDFLEGRLIPVQILLKQQMN